MEISQASFIIGVDFSPSRAPQSFLGMSGLPQMKVFQSRALCSAAKEAYYTPRKKQLAPPLPPNCPKLTKSWKKQPVSLTPKSNSMGSTHSWTKLDPWLHPETLKKEVVDLDLQWKTILMELYVASGIQRCVFMSSVVFKCSSDTS